MSLPALSLVLLAESCSVMSRRYFHLLPQHDHLVEGLPNGWRVYPIEIPKSSSATQDFAPLRAEHTEFGVSVLATPATLLERVRAVDRGIYAVPALHPYKVKATYMVHEVERAVGGTRYFIQDPTEIASYSAEVMYEHGVPAGYLGQVKIERTVIPVPEDELAPMPVRAPDTSGEKTEASPRRVQGRPAGQTLSDRPTRQAVELLGNADNAENDGAPVVDIVARLMRDGYEYSHAMQGIEHGGDGYVNVLTWMRFAGMRTAAETTALADDPTPAREEVCPDF